MAFFNYFVGADYEEQQSTPPPAYSNEGEDVKCGSKPNSCDKPQPCNPCPKPPSPCKPCNPCPKPPSPCKPCNPCKPRSPCKPPKPNCPVLPQPPKPCCTPCPPRPPKRCPQPCPKPLPCRKPCNPCEPPRCSDDSSWDSDTDNSSDCKPPCPPGPVCIYNACNLVIATSINLLISAFALLFAVGQPTVNVFNVVFLALNIAINFLGLAGLYNNCHDYIQLAAWWQWPSVLYLILLSYQFLIVMGPSALADFLITLTGFPNAFALGNFLKALPPALLNLLVAAFFVFHAASLIYFAFQWAQAACARCVVVDCDSECGWYSTIIELIGSLLPVPVNIIQQVFTVLASLCPPTAKSAAVGYGSYEAAAEKAV